MVVAGLRKSSLIDYPGKVSCVVFVSGCNFACPYCHNPQLATGQAAPPADLDSILEFIDGRRNFLDGVVISGGEPTLWSGLTDLCGEIHAMGLSVKLDTNGSRPAVLARLIGSGRLNYIAMDLKTVPDQYRPPLCHPSAWSKVKQSIPIIMQSGVAYEFRTTCVKPFVDENRIRRMAAEIAGADQYVLQKFRPDTMLDPGFFNHTDPGFTPQALDRLRAAAAPLVSNCRIR